MLGQTFVTRAVETQKGPLKEAWEPRKASQRRNPQVIPLELGKE